MNTHDSLDDLIRDRLRTEAPREAPGHLFDTTMHRIAGTPQRGGWLARSGRQAAGGRGRPAPRRRCRDAAGRAHRPPGRRRSFAQPDGRPEREPIGHDSEPIGEHNAERLGDGRRRARAAHRARGGRADVPDAVPAVADAAGRRDADLAAGPPGDGGSDPRHADADGAGPRRPAPGGLRERPPGFRRHP